MRNNIKKIAAAAAVGFSLLLSGCGAKMPFVQRAPSFDSTYTVTADITYDKVTAKAELTRVNNTEWSCTFVEPKALSGLSIALNDKKYAATLDGLTFSAADSAVYAAAPQMIAKAVSLLSGATNEQLTAADGVLTFTDEIDGKRVTITADERTGSLISLKLPQQKLSVSFSDQKPYTPVNHDEEKATLTDE